MLVLCIRGNWEISRRDHHSLQFMTTGSPNGSFLDYPMVIFKFYHLQAGPSTRREVSLLLVSFEKKKEELFEMVCMMHHTAVSLRWLS
ncbi:hypothetical protein ACS0TY_005247 [Phlomoides rotata]